MSQDNSYSRIFKGVAVFGGTQIIQILIQIIRGKLVSILIGAVGMGLSSIYSSSVNMIVSFSGLGLGASGVRDISESSTISDINQRNERLSIINQCFYLTYIIGFVVCLLLSPLLSYLTFGDFSYTLIYCLFSFYVVFEICSSHHVAILQGLGMIKKLAKATISITFLTFLIAISFYYFFGIDGIIPVMILGSFTSALIRFCQVRKIRIPFKWHPLKLIIKECKTMYSVGLVSLMSLVMNNVVAYLINIFISRYGSIADVGFFNAANTIILQSVSMIFAAMSADYYPRLAKIANNRKETNAAVNRQTEILCYLAMPILGVMIIFSSWIIHLLLSEEFMVITDFIKWISLGTAIQVFFYPLGHVIWAKGDIRVLFYLEGIYNSLARLIIYVFSYYMAGFKGLGYGVCISNILLFVIYSVILHVRYGYVRDSSVMRLYIYIIPLTLAVLLSIQGNTYLYALAILLVVTLSIDCLYKLNLRLNLVENIRKRFRNSR